MKCDVALWVRAHTLALCSTWCLVVAYAFSFGVELTMNNIINGYFLDNFDISLMLAGLCGASFGLMNLFSRSLGGLLSDKLGARVGMRGRLAALFVLQVRSAVAHLSVAVLSCQPQ